MFDAVAVAVATRRRILSLLAEEGGLCVCEFTAALDNIQPKISRRLYVLKDVGVAIPRREGTRMFYRLSSSLPASASARSSTAMRRRI